MNGYVKYIVFLLLCVLSRVISAIYYIEDPESLRFALCVFDQFDLKISQPNFPGYPVFCFIAKILYFIFGNFSIVFSIIGGISVYFIIVYALKLLKVPLLSLEGVLAAILIFFNPMIWLMSNKYMPDLAGLAVMVAAFSYLVPDTYREKDLLRGWLLAGLLTGIKLSYFSFLILPCIYAYFVKKKYLQSTVFFALGVLIWLIPMGIDTGWNNLLEIGKQQVALYLYSSGSSFNYINKTLSFAQSIWADGMGGYWLDRNPALLITSFGLAACSFFGFLIIMSFGYSRLKIIVITGSCLLYALWIYFFQNLAYESWHVLPLIPFIIILVSYGIIYFLVNYNYLYVKVLMLVFLLGNVFITIVLVVQHTYPTGIAQVKEYIINKKQADEEITIVSFPLINQFLSDQNVRAKYISVNDVSLLQSRKKLKFSKKRRMILIGNQTPLIYKKPINMVHFAHNPYVNRLWPDIYVYEYYSSE